MIPDRNKTDKVYYFLGCILIRRLYKNGNFSSPDKQAEKYLQKAIALGNENAKYELGRAYSKRLISEYSDKQSYQLALKYLLPFADKGLLPAIVTIGTMFCIGYYENDILEILDDSIPNPGRNYEKALHYLEIAARNNVTEVYVYLGEIYELGRGVKKNFELAKYYYNKAWYEAGDQFALKKLNEWRY